MENLVLQSMPLSKRFLIINPTLCAAGASQQLLPQRCHKAAHVAGGDREDIAGGNTLYLCAFF